MDTHGSVHPYAFLGLAPPSRHRGTEPGGGMLCLSPPHPPRRASHHDGASCGRLRALSLSLASLSCDCCFSNRHTILCYSLRHDGHSLAPIIVPSWRSYTKRASNYIAFPHSLTPNLQPHPQPLSKGEGSKMSDKQYPSHK